MSYNDYYNSRNGRGIDVDGSYDAQCWDGYADYCRFLGVPFANCTSTGYAQDIWTNRHSNGMLNYFDEVEIMQPGDIAVFAVTPSTPYSHVAIFHGDAGGGSGWFFGQNQGGAGGVYNLVKLPYSATFATAFRRKGTGSASSGSSASPQSSAGWIAENGTFTSAYPIYARVNGPATSNASPYLFPAGSRIKYDAYIHANKYVWIRQKRGDGSYWYIPTGPTNGQARTDKAWGSFE